jgi:hypothetical protein
MRTRLFLSLAVGLITASVLAQEIKTAPTGGAVSAKKAQLAPTLQFAKVQKLIAEQKYNEALQLLLEIYDKVAATDPEMAALVLQAIVELKADYSPALQALLGKRDALMKQIGEPPTVGPGLYQVIQINAALGDIRATEELMAKVMASSSVKQFSTTIKSAVPTVPDSTKVVNLRIRSRMQNLYSKAVTGLGKQMLANELLVVQTANADELKAVNAEIEKLQGALKTQATEVESLSPGGITVDKQYDVVQEMQTDIALLDEYFLPLMRDLKGEADYYGKVQQWNSQRTD